MKDLFDFITDVIGEIVVILGIIVLFIIMAGVIF